MEDSAESKTDDAEKELLGSSNSSLDLKKVKPPNKKKHEDEVDHLQNIIKEKEGKLKVITGVNLPGQLKATRAEKHAVIEKLKKIDTDLKTLSQQITKKKGVQDQLNSRLHYRAEERIDDAIRKLRWQLQNQNFKLSEEKKIVAEIDSLNRSKKDLCNFLAAKKEVDDIRDRQRRMREERDRYQKNVNHLRKNEDEFKKQMDDRKKEVHYLKKEIDKYYGQKRNLIQEFRHQEKEYNEVKDEMKKQKKRDSFKRKEESKSHMEAFQNDIEEFGVKREPYEDEIKLCNTLINYLQKFQVNEEDEVEVEEVSKHPGGVVDELEGGKYILLKKTEDTEYSGVRPTRRRSSKKGKKFSVTKPITHAPQIFSQFASLMLNAPSTIPEIEVSLEQILARKRFYEEGGRGPRVITPSIEENSASETGISATESAMCEMSRQASNTESTENPEVSLSVMDELVKMSNNDDNLSEMSEDTLARSNSDSTERTNSEADHSESSSSHTDHESRKGSDVSEAESTVFSPLSQKKAPFQSTTNSAPKPNIPLSFDANKTETSSEDVDNNSSEADQNKNNEDLKVPKSNEASEHKLLSHGSDNSDTCICDSKTGFTAKKDQSNSPNIELSPQSVVDSVNTDKSAHNIGGQGISHFDISMPAGAENDQCKSLSGSLMGEAKDTVSKQSICSQNDSFVVIDDNCNIHDVKESSSDYSNDNNVIYSTHL